MQGVKNILQSSQDFMCVPTQSLLFFKLTTVEEPLKDNILAYQVNQRPIVNLSPGKLNIYL